MGQDPNCASLTRRSGAFGGKFALCRVQNTDNVTFEQRSRFITFQSFVPVNKPVMCYAAPTAPTAFCCAPITAAWAANSNILCN